MNFLRRQFWIICTLVFLLLASGQALHAYVDTSCALTEEKSSCPDQQDCPIGHCCHSHLCCNLMLLEPVELFFMTSPSVLLRLKNETLHDGPCKEIDYPPQVS